MELTINDRNIAAASELTACFVQQNEILPWGGFKVIPVNYFHNPEHAQQGGHISFYWSEGLIEYGNNHHYLQINKMFAQGTVTVHATKTGRIKTSLRYFGDRFEVHKLKNVAFVTVQQDGSLPDQTISVDPQYAGTKVVTFSFRKIHFVYTETTGECLPFCIKEAEMEAA